MHLPAIPAFAFDQATRRIVMDPHDRDFGQDPYAVYAFLHAHAPVFYWKDYGHWFFTRYDDVNRLLRDKRFGREVKPGCVPDNGPRGDRSHLVDFDAFQKHSMLELEPPAHTRLRKLVNRAFVSRQVERLRPMIETLVHELIDAIEAEREADLIPALATPVPIMVIAEMMGVPREMAPQLLDWSHRMVAMHVHGTTRETEERANTATREFSDYIRGFVARRRTAPGDDLFSVLIAAHEDGERLSEPELVASAIQLLNAGHEATVHQTGNAICSILAQGGDPRRFFSDDPTSAATVEECLRFDPPLHLFKRYAYEPVEVAPETMPGLVIEPGRQVGLLLGAANRDPAAFADPHHFDPARADQKNVAFGAGIHFCIGAPLARLEMQLSLKILFERLPLLALAEPPVYRDTWHFHGLERVLCRW